MANSKKKKKNTNTSKNSSTKKVTTNKKSNNNKSTPKNREIVTEKVIEEPIVSVKEEVKEEKPKKKKEESKIVKLNKNINSVKSKYKKLDTSYKVLLGAIIVCTIILALEGIMVLSHKKQVNDHKIFYDRYNSVALDGNNIVVVGTTDIKETEEEDNIKDNARGKITKYDNKGHIDFQKIYSNGIATAFNSVITEDDGYIVVGTGIFSKEEKETEGQEAVILKYSKEGELVWEKFYRVITNTSFSKVIKVSDGYVAVGQSIYANMEVGNHATGGAIIVKYDFNGNEVWHNNHGGSKSGNFNDVVEVNGDLYAVGKDATDWGNIVKYDKNGKYKWHKNYAYTDGNGFMGIAYQDNALYVVGSKKILPEGTGDEDDRTTLNTDALFIKYDLDGNIVFEKVFGGSSFERYNSIVAYHNNFYIVGHICSKDAGVKITNTTIDNMTGFIVRYDINGNILKKETLGGSKNDNLTDIKTDGISYYAVGYSNSKDGNIKTGKNNGKDYIGKVIKLNNKFRRMYVN